MANTYIYNMSDLWTVPTQQYAAIGMNVTDTASLANSHLLRLQVGSVNRFTIDKTGNAVGASFFGTGTVSAPAITTNGIFTAGNTIGNAALFYDSGNNTLAQFNANVNTDIQVTFTNINTGNNASADFVLYDNLGILANNFVNMGINGNNYNQATWTINGPSDAYLYTGNTSFAIGTNGTSSNLVFFTGGTLAANERMRLTNVSVIIANSSALVANGSNGAVGAVLSSNGTGINWTTSLANVSSMTFTNTTSTAVANASNLRIGNGTTNSVFTSNSLTLSNTSSVSVINVSTIALGNGTAAVANTVLTTSSIVVQNSSASISIVNPANLTITSNTGLNIGTPTLAANGFSYLPNGLLANWGWVSANTISGTITFTRAFTAVPYSVQLTAAVAAANNPYHSANPTTSGATVRNQSTGTGANVFYFAIGV